MKSKFSYHQPCFWWLPAMVVFCVAAGSHGQILEGHNLTERMKQSQTEALSFTASDFIRVCLDPPAKNAFMLGEPVPVSFRVVNHTQFNVALHADLDYRTGVSVMIRDKPGAPGRRYTGPYETAGHLPAEMILYPFEERPIQILVWGDIDQPTGLAFPAAGQYALDFKLKISVPTIKLTAEMAPIDPITLAVEKPRVIQVVAPSSQDAPLVDALISQKAAPQLQRKYIAPERLDAWTALAQTHQATPITPYVTLAIGAYYSRLAALGEDQAGSREKASEFLQMTALADSAFKPEAWLALLTLYDQWGLVQPARDAALNYIKASPPQVAPMLGSNDLVRRYLPNSTEMDPEMYWDLLD